MSNGEQPHVSAWAKGLEAANAAPRCGAKTKRRGTPCRSAGMANGRCRIHGGASTGPRTAEGLERSRKARWKHGLRSEEAIRQQKEGAALRREIRRLADLAKTFR